MRKRYISVVATTRNDNHGGSLTYRMQHFVDGFVQQCKRHDLDAELILVEWNPPQDSPPLAQALNFPSDKGPCSIRIIRVPPEVHLQYRYAVNLPLYQMIGKNVGIRRALGQFVLATNIDILFSDAVICFMRDKLKDNTLYRTDRLDVPAQLPSTPSFDELLAFCQSEHFRINGRDGTQKVAELQSSKVKQLFLSTRSCVKQAAKRALSSCRFLGIPHHLHTNGCGDFTLLSSDNWERLRGYPEWDMHSFHIDSVLLYQAYYHGIKEIDLPKEMPIYHIEHSPGSGYSAEAAHLLFQRLHEKGVRYLRYCELVQIAEAMHGSSSPTVYNDADWGLSKLDLEETTVSYV